MGKNTLIEICTEELPPKQLKTLADHFASQMQTELQEALFSFKAIEIFATPRRLAVLIHDLSEYAKDLIKERKGPALMQSKDLSGSPTPALIGFAKSCGVAIEQLSTKEFEGKSHFIFLENKKGDSIFNVLPNLLIRVLGKLPAKKRMRWGDGDFEFIRPLRSLLILYGDQVVPAQIFGVQSGRQTQAHRQHAEQEILIPSPETYESQLEQAGVMASFDKRRQYIVEKTQSLIQTHFADASPVWSDELIDEVTGLVENPNLLIGKFESDFLKLPREILIAVMRDHQRYFAIQKVSGELLPCFVIISNIPSQHPEEVISGNETVLHARFSDALFFYYEDLKKMWFSSNAQEKLKGILFQGNSSLWDKLLRMQKIGSALAEILFKDQYANLEFKNKLDLIFQSCKIDLLTNMVGEFPELQGIVGQHYVLQDLEFKHRYFSTQPEGILEFAQGLKEQYLPRFSGDELPTSTWGILLSLTDRLDSFVFLSCTQGLPTGNKDPFGLRRMLLAIIRIYLKNQFHFSLRVGFEFSMSAMQEQAFGEKKVEKKAFLDSLMVFSKERFKQEMQSQYGYSADICEAVIVADESGFDVYDYYLKISALHALQMEHKQAFLSLSQLHKRVFKILSKNPGERISLSGVAFEIKQELDLYAAYQKGLSDWNSIFGAKTKFSIQDYLSFCQGLLELESPLSMFFDQLLVEEPAHKNRRLSLLDGIYNLLNRFADFSKLSSG